MEQTPKKGLDMASDAVVGYRLKEEPTVDGVAEVLRETERRLRTILTEGGHGTVELVIFDRNIDVMGGPRRRFRVHDPQTR